MGELNVYGVYIPMLLVQAVLAYILLILLRKCTDLCVGPTWIALPSIFYLCLYVLLLGAIHWVFYSFYAV